MGRRRFQNPKQTMLSPEECCGDGFGALRLEADIVHLDLLPSRRFNDQDHVVLIECPVHDRVVPKCQYGPRSIFPPCALDRPGRSRKTCRVPLATQSSGNRPCPPGPGQNTVPDRDRTNRNPAHRSRTPPSTTPARCTRREMACRKMRKWQTVGSGKDVMEAGGVEPPSEKPCHPKTTCLARSGSNLPVKAGCSFASCAQSGQETLPASPIISPPHYGPKRDSQPAI